MITARELCIALIKDASQRYRKPIQATLDRIKFKSSRDVGQIVFGLAEKGLLLINPDESIGDYDDIFTIDTIDEFLSEAERSPKTFSLSGWRRKIMWTLYIIGTAIVAASYVNLVLCPLNNSG